MVPLNSLLTRPYIDLCLEVTGFLLTALGNVIAMHRYQMEELPEGVIVQL